MSTCMSGVGAENLFWVYYRTPPTLLVLFCFWFLVLFVFLFSSC